MLRECRPDSNSVTPQFAIIHVGFIRKKNRNRPRFSFVLNGCTSCYNDIKWTCIPHFRYLSYRGIDDWVIRCDLKSGSSRVRAALSPECPKPRTFLCEPRPVQVRPTECLGFCLGGGGIYIYSEAINSRRPLSLLQHFKIIINN